MQKQARQTGLAFQDMAKSFGSELDTFGGATQMAGKINAILGRSALNPLELLGADEATRAKLVQDALKESPMALEALQKGKKFEIKAMASALKMSPLQLRKLLSGEGEVKGALQKRIDERTGEGYGEGESMSKLATNAGFATNEMKRMTDAIKNLRLETDNERIRIVNAARGAGLRTMQAMAKMAGVEPALIDDFKGQPDMLRNLIEAKAYGAPAGSGLEAMIRTRTAKPEYGPTDLPRGPEGVGTQLEKISKTAGAFGDFFGSAMHMALPKDVVLQTALIGAMNADGRDGGSLSDRLGATQKELTNTYAGDADMYGTGSSISREQQEARDKLARNKASAMAKKELTDATAYAVEKYNLGSDWVKKASTDDGSGAQSGESKEAQKQLLETISVFLGDDMARLISTQLVTFIRKVIP